MCKLYPSPFDLHQHAPDSAGSMICSFSSSSLSMSQANLDMPRLLQVQEKSWALVGVLNVKRAVH